MMGEAEREARIFNPHISTKYQNFKFKQSTVQALMTVVKIKSGSKKVQGRREECVDIFQPLFSFFLRLLKSFVLLSPVFVHQFTFMFMLHINKTFPS